jgi:uncharacterized protein
MPVTLPETDAGLTPTPAQERCEFLDVLRGFALAGIVLANMVSYSLHLYLPVEAKAGLPAATWDGIVEFFELALIESKFYTIFSVLFGVGFSILLARANAKGLAFHRFFLRRMAFLFLIGLAHAVLLWHNDILQAYAVCGALLLPFATADNRTILLASVASLTAPAVVSALGILPADTLTGPRDLLLTGFGFTAADSVRIWAHGALRDIVRLNIASWFGQLDYVVTSGMIFRISGCFLLGLAIGRSGIHSRLASYSTIIERIALFGLCLGIPLNVIYARTFESESWIYTAVSTLGVMPLSAGYVSLLALIWMQNGRALTDIFGPVGRTALTNYVAQSLICALVFRGVGLGLGGQVGPTLYMPIGFTVYVAQVVISRAWLTRFQFGPLEWVWRMLTYGRRVRLLKSPPLLAQ